MNKLKELRKENKISQKEIANKLQISQNGYSQYEGEKRDIPTKALHILANYYNTSIDYILGRTSEKKPYPK